MASMLTFLNEATEFLSSLGLNTGCSFTISCAGSSITLPVSPGSFEVGNTYNNSSVNVNALGDINMLGNRGLMTIKFGSFFPAQGYTFAGITMQSPYSYVAKLKEFATKKQPCKFSISGTSVNTPVTIDSFTFKEQDGTSDVYFDISLTEYRYILPTSDKKNSTTKLASRVAESVKEKGITYYANMDLMDVAAEVVGQLWPITEQGAQQQKVFKELVKAGIAVSSTVKATKLQMQLENLIIKM